MCQQDTANNALGTSAKHMLNSSYVTFTDFIVQYHKIPHSDLSLVNKIEFTMKKRSLIHQLCFNIHTHLLGSLMNLPEDYDTQGYDTDLFPNKNSSHQAYQ